LKYYQKWIVEDLRDGKRKPTDIDWWQVSNGSVEELRFIAYALQEKAGYNQAVEMVECALYQSKIESKVSEDYAKRVSALLDYWQKIESRYRQHTPSSRTDQPPVEPTEPTETVDLANNTFSIPRYLQADRAENMLKALEDVTGYDNKPVLDRSKTPWGYSSQPDWGHAAKKIVEKLGITMHWEDWGNLIGTDGKKLQKAYNNSSQSSDSKNRITNAIKSIK
jgi:hypothetical protein